MARQLNDWLAAYLNYTSKLEAPEHLHYWTGVSTIASALQRKVHFTQREFNWYPNFYILIVGPPGIVNKSTTISVGTRILRQLPNIKFAPASISWQWLADELAKNPDIYYSQGTPKIQTSITCAISELSKFVDWTDPKMLSWIVDAYDCPDKDDRANFTRGQTEIQNLFVNLIGAITPIDFRNSMDAIAKEGGFLSRCVTLYADRKRHRTAYLDDYKPNEEDQRARAIQDLYQDLLDIHQMEGRFTLTSDARTFGIKWYDTICDTMEDYIRQGKSTSQLARFQTIVHKLAMVISASRSSSLKITKDILAEAITRVEGARPHLRQALGVADAVLEHQHANRLVDLIAKNGVMDERTLWSMVNPHMSYKDFKSALDHAFYSREVIRAQLDSGRYLYTKADS